MAAEPAARWASVNANHMLPSGSSLFHPHLQGIVDSQPTTFQRLLAEVPAERFTAYLDAERRSGERYLADTGRVQWLVSFAPVAPAELRAFVPGICSPAELGDDLVAELAFGLERALGGYAGQGLESFNCAIYGAPPGTDGLPAEPAAGLPLEPEAVLPLRLHVPGAPALGGRRRPGPGDRRRLDGRAVRRVSGDH